MSQDDTNNSDSINALRERFAQQSRKAQAYYTVMHAARGRLGSDEAASAWMEAPASALEGKTPAQLVGEGRAEEALACAGSLKP